METEKEFIENKNENLIKKKLQKRLDSKENKANQNSSIENESSNNPAELKNKGTKVNAMKNNLNIAIETMNYEEAIILCKKILFFVPHDIDTYMILADLYLKIYDISSSVTCVKKVVLIKNKLDSEKGKDKGYSAAKIKNYTDSYNNFNNINSYNSKDNPNKEAQDAKINSQNTITAKTYTKNSLKIILKNIEFCKGLLKSQSSKLLETELERLSKINNTSLTLIDYYFLRAKSFLSLGNVKESINDIRKILTIEPKNDTAIVLLAQIYKYQGKGKEGENLMWKAYHINPENKNVKIFTTTMKKEMNEVIKEANINVLKGRLKNGLLLSMKALKIYPNHPDALFLRSSIYKSMGNLTESINDLNRAKRYGSEGSSGIFELIEKSLSNIYNELSLRNLENKNYSEALNYINQALKSNPRDIYAHLNKGDYFLKQKDLINAKDEYLICYNIDHNFKEVIIRLSTVFYKLAILSYNSKDYEEALEHLNKALFYYNGSDIIHVLRARTYLKLEKVKEAYEDAMVAYLINPKNQDAIEITKFFNQ